MVAAGIGNTWWQYLLLFVLVAASWAGVPAIGTAALGSAAVAASQRRLDLAAVIVVAVIAGEAGGLCYAIGRRWGRQLLERPGRHQARREKIMERGEDLYARWGWLAVFVTPAIVSGTAKMPPYRFASWNLLDSLMWTVSVAASAYGVSRLVTGHHTWHDVAILVIGLGAGTFVIVTAVRRHRRRTARRTAPAAAASGDPA